MPPPRLQVRNTPFSKSRHEDPNAHDTARSPSPGPIPPFATMQSPQDPTDVCECGHTHPFDGVPIGAEHTIHDVETDVVVLEKAIQEYSDEIRTLRSILTTAQRDKQKREGSIVHENTLLSEKVLELRTRHNQINQQCEEMSVRRKQLEQHIKKVPPVEPGEVEELTQVCKALKELCKAREKQGDRAKEAILPLIKEQIDALMPQHGFKNISEVPTPIESQARVDKARATQKAVLASLQDMRTQASQIDSQIKRAKERSFVKREATRARSLHRDNRHSPSHLSQPTNVDLVLELRHRLRVLQRSLQSEGTRDRIESTLDAIRREAHAHTSQIMNVTEQIAKEQKFRRETKNLCDHFAARVQEISGDMNVDRQVIQACQEQTHCDRTHHTAALKDLVASYTLYDHIFQKVLNVLKEITKSNPTITQSTVVGDVVRLEIMEKEVGNLKMELFELKNENAELLRRHQTSNRARSAHPPSPIRRKSNLSGPRGSSPKPKLR